MHGTREERTRAYASSMVGPLYRNLEREGGREKRAKDKEERRGGVNDRVAARSQRDVYYRGSASTPAEKIVKGRYVTRYTDGDLPV